MICRYDHDARDYLTPDGEPCRRDDYGDPTHHCTAKRTCSMHVGPGEQTCAKCLGRTRRTIRQIVDLTTLTPIEAISAGIDSEAANLAGPAVDPRHWSERRVAMRSHLTAWWHRGQITEDQALAALTNMPEDDDRHPALLTRWHMMIAEDYGHDLPERMTLTDSAAYLDRQLGRIAQDERQDFPLLAREVKRCRDHLEAVLRNGENAERGAPCPECTSPTTGVGPRLRRQHGHWCWDEDCEQQFHYLDESGDVWVCPRDRDHWWTAEGYAEMLQKRQEQVKRERMGA